MKKEKNDVSKSNRRNFMGKSAVMAAGAGVAGSTAAVAQPKLEKRVIHANGKKPENTPLFSGMVAYGNLLFLSGVGYHKEGDIKVHTEKVLEQIKHNLEAAGSSMEKVLKASVFLADLKDYDAMNEVFRGKFGPEPPVRTTVSVSGVPGKSLVEIDVIAYI